MAGEAGDIDWLVRQADEYHLAKNDIGEMVEDLDDIGKLGHGLSVIVTPQNFKFWMWLKFN
jgi:hypothetical protein